MLTLPGFDFVALPPVQPFPTPAPGGNLNYPSTSHWVFIFVNVFFYLGLLIIALLTTSCPGTDMSQSDYVFQAVQDSSLMARSGKLMNLSYPQRIEEWGQSMAAFRGALLRLFGEPLWTTDLADEAFAYVIKATDKQGNSWVLTAYHGASGLAIGGNSGDKSIYPVAEALLYLIKATPPADFEAVVYDWDEGFIVTYGCKNEGCYWHEVPGSQEGK